MMRFLYMLIFIAALALPALCQNGRLTPQDQREFDKAYEEWTHDTRKNDRDDIAKDVRKMQDIMARNNIPPDVPYDRIASNGYAPQDRYDQDRNDNDQGRYNGAYSQNGRSWGNQGRLSPEDQRDFDHYYSRWVNDSRRNDRDDADRDARHMQDIMQRNNLPPDVPYDQVATPSGDRNNGYNDNRYSQGGNSGYGQTRLSPEDQHEFDKAYAKWVNDSRKNDRDDLEKDTRKMQDIMARYNIPSDVPYDQIASQSAGYRH